MKRILAVLLCIALTFGSVFSAYAEQAGETQPTETVENAETTQPDATEGAEETIDAEENTAPPVKPEKPKFVKRPGMTETDVKMEELAWDIFTDCQVSSKRHSFHGYCGNFVSHQLYNLGINRGLSTRHGKDHFDYYSSLEKTTGGYFPRAISASEVHLTGALNYITEQGARDVYNVMVGFDWTHTEAGNKYGHVVLIYAIVGGALYFSESFDMYFKGRIYPEGSIVKCSVEEFVDYYDGWTTYEGIVVFGTTDYSDFCKQENTNLTVQTRFDTVLRSQPCQVGKNESALIRNISAGERLQATGVFTNGEEELFYRIADGDLVGYVSANAVSVLRANAFNCYIEALNMPRIIPQGQAFQLSGAVAGEYARVRGVTAQIVTGDNQILQEANWENFSNYCKLDALNSKLNFQNLPEDFYTLKILGFVRCPTADGELLEAKEVLGGAYFRVGGEDFVTRAMPSIGYQEAVDALGWRYQDGWCFYEGAEPKTGWLTWCGAQYYFDALGQAATGLVTIKDKQYYFSGSGALVKNARLELDGTVYETDGFGVATEAEK